jgi:NAD(P)-dependent dehydrogenase (short-subunit alcohol dehydrogenase family)
MGAPSERRRGVVTAAGGGVGKAVVPRPLREGVEVLAVDINRASLIHLENSVARRSQPTSGRPCDG